MKFITSTTLVACTTLIMSLQQVVQAGTPVMWLNNYGTVVYNQNLANGCYDISGVSTAQGSFSGPSGFALYTGYGCTGNELVYSLGAANVGYISTNSWCHQAYSMKLF